MMGRNPNSEENSNVVSSTDTLRKPHKCPYDGCNQQFYRPSRLKIHICSHTGELPYKCRYPDCNKAYTSTSHLKRHFLSHNDTKCYEKTFNCPFEGCLLMMKSPENVKKHIKRKHDIQKILECPSCSSTFTNKKQLKKHSLEHTILGFSCCECNSEFLSYQHLEKHLRKIHKCYLCNELHCGKLLDTWTLLQKHLKLEHPRVYTCEHCNKEFYHKGRFNSHVKTHMDLNERKLFVCHYNNCERIFLYQKNLDHHIQSSHLGKKFPCTHDGCSMNLSSKSNLIKHLKLHNEIGPLRRKRQKPRKKRKDAGIHKRSMAVKLAGLHLPLSIEADLLTGNISKHINHKDDLNYHEIETIVSPLLCNTDVPA